MWIDDFTITNFLSKRLSKPQEQIEADVLFYSKFVLGGISGMFAWCFVHPLDLVKNRKQVDAGAGSSRQSTLGLLANIVKQAGV